jgi:hypothetical protein
VSLKSRGEVVASYGGQRGEGVKVVRWRALSQSVREEWCNFLLHERGGWWCLVGYHLIHDGRVPEDREATFEYRRDVESPFR